MTAIQPDLDQMRERIDHIDTELHSLRPIGKVQSIDPDALAAAIHDPFRSLDYKANEDPRVHLRQLIDAFLEQIIFDQKHAILRSNCLCRSFWRAVSWTSRCHQLTTGHPPALKSPLGGLGKITCLKLVEAD